MKGSIDLNGFNKDNAPFAFSLEREARYPHILPRLPSSRRSALDTSTLIDATVLPGQCPRDDTILSRVSIHWFGHRPVTANKCDA